MDRRGFFETVSGLIAMLPFIRTSDWLATSTPSRAGAKTIEVLNVGPNIMRGGALYFVGNGKIWVSCVHDPHGR